MHLRAHFIGSSLIVLSSLLAVGCRFSPPLIDPATPAETRRLLERDAQWLMERKLSKEPQRVLIEGNPMVNTLITERYEQVFGDSEPVSVGKFIYERVGYVLPERTVLNLERGGIHELRHRMRSEGLEPKAFNAGFLWLSRIAHFDKGDRVGGFLDGLEVPLISPRMGLVQLRENFVERTRYGPTTPILRIGLMVHEARHSDCAVVPTVEQLSELPGNPSWGLSGSSCMYLHTQCPSDHEFPNQFACDSSTHWGPYFIESMFMLRFANDCINCSELDLLQARTHGLDRLNRVLDFGDLLVGRVPLDLSSLDDDEEFLEEREEIWSQFYQRRRELLGLD